MGNLAKGKPLSHLLPRKNAPRFWKSQVLTIILGIESSCDETAAALVSDGRVILAQHIASQDEQHRPYGGVVPEIAARAHAERLAPMIAATLADAGITINRPPRDGHMAFVKTPDGISVELLQNGHLEPKEPWASMANTGSW